MPGQDSAGKCWRLFRYQPRPTHRPMLELGVHARPPPPPTARPVMAFMSMVLTRNGKTKKKKKKNITSGVAMRHLALPLSPIERVMAVQPAWGSPEKSCNGPVKPFFSNVPIKLSLLSRSTRLRSSGWSGLWSSVASATAPSLITIRRASPTHPHCCQYCSLQSFDLLYFLYR